MIVTVPLIPVEGVPVPMPSIIAVPGISIYELSRTDTHATVRIEAENIQPAIDACNQHGWEYEL